MQHLGVNFGVIWKFELFSFSGYLFFAQEIRADFFKSPVTTLLPTWQRAHAAAGLRRVHAMHVLQCHYLSV